jgi:hypothetical protein
MARGSGVKLTRLSKFNFASCHCGGSALLRGRWCVCVGGAGEEEEGSGETGGNGPKGRDSPSVDDGGLLLPSSSPLSAMMSANRPNSSGERTSGESERGEQETRESRRRTIRLCASGSLDVSAFLPYLFPPSRHFALFLSSRFPPKSRQGWPTPAN